jgi:hypothetical protein
VADFTADWLAAREPADAVARSRTLTQALAERLEGRDRLGVLDLGSGTGSNLRYLATRLPRHQEWLLTDRDAALLQIARTSIPETEALRVTTRVLDLRALGDYGWIFEGRALVTASALLDLVSVEWLETLAGRCRASQSAALFALTYDGRVRCSPEDPDDAIVLALVNRHQLTDKGFGTAVGTNAITRAEACFTALGYETMRGDSSWVLSPADDLLQRWLVAGWAKAACEMAGPEEPSAAIEAWESRRLAHIAAKRSHIEVGHEDLVAWPDSR